MTELLVACSLAGILIAAVASEAARSHVALSSLQHATSTEDDMRALQDTISQHLKKAGYVYSSDLFTPFLTASGTSPRPKNVVIAERSSEALNSCVTFSYDKNSDGVASMEQGELLGFRLNQNAIEYRVAGKTCEQGGWFDLTDPKTVKATKFSIKLASHSSWGSAYELEIRLQSKVDPEVKSYKRFVVEVEND
ncbi:potassium:proton antiporter [Alteromonas gracilis]|uniref:potassium:proton antiporter n=1 Tax=Alteromonas gracilis TaxID=1479524 RepID=UPI003735BC67